MPYINKEDRTPDMLNSISCLVNEIESKGDLNYTICQLTAELIRKTGGMGYTNVSNWIDGVHGAERELTRRLLIPYEKIKEDENGDVEGFVVLLKTLKG